MDEHVPILLVGAGYCGDFAARRWARQGTRVVATTRDKEKAESLQEDGVETLILNLDTPVDELPTTNFATAPVVIVSVPPNREDPERKQEQKLADWLLQFSPQRVLYWSATSVYPNLDGGEISDTSDTGPESDRGKRRLEAENTLRERLGTEDIPFESLRLVGIYGPGRTKRGRIARGDYTYPGDGRRISNRIHRDDVVSATEHVMSLDAQTRDWTVSDGNPFEAIELIRFVCEENDLSMPESVPMSEISPRKRSFWQGNRKIVPERLKETGWEPIYPSFRTGLIASWKEEDASE